MKGNKIKDTENPELNFTKDEIAARANIIVKPYTVNIYMGYGWDGNNVLSDKYWRFWREKFSNICECTERNIKKVCPYFVVGFNRLRASHSQFVYSSIVEKIKAADVLIFDISAANGIGFNSNVLIEFGIALGLGKEPFLLCNRKMSADSLKEFKGLKIVKNNEVFAIPKFPSDIASFTVSFYSAEEKGDKWSAKFKEPSAFYSKLRGRIADAANKKLVNYLENKKLSLEK